MNLMRAIEIYAYGNENSGRRPGYGSKSGAGSVIMPTSSIPLEESIAKLGQGRREVLDGMSVYYPTYEDSAKLGHHVMAIIAGRNALTYHETSSGTKYHYQGQSLRTSSSRDAVKWAVGMHVAKQQDMRERIAQIKKSNPLWGSGALWKMLENDLQSYGTEGMKWGFKKKEGRDKLGKLPIMQP